MGIDFLVSYFSRETGAFIRGINIYLLIERSILSYVQALSEIPSS